jgi:chromosome segregation ATPase
MDLAPVEELQALLHERRRVSEKITSAQSALGIIRNNLSASLAQQYVHHSVSPIDFKEGSMKEEHTYERLLQALHDMQAQIEERVRPVAEQVVEAEVARLRELSERHHSALQDCLAQIDQHILHCRSQIDEYQQTRSDLAALNERLAKLGAEPAALPAPFAIDSFGDVIRSRVDGLRAEGKI